MYEDARMWEVSPGGWFLLYAGGLPPRGGDPPPPPAAPHHPHGSPLALYWFAANTPQPPPPTDQYYCIENRPRTPNQGVDEGATGWWVLTSLRLKHNPFKPSGLINHSTSCGWESAETRESTGSIQDDWPPLYYIRSTLSLSLSQLPFIFLRKSTTWLKRNEQNENLWIWIFFF